MAEENREHTAEGFQDLLKRFKTISTDIVKQRSRMIPAGFPLRLLFRGEARDDPTWRLIPRVFRANWNESALLYEFQAGAHSRYRDCPAAADYLRWLTLAQHHGLPTRLLDWTTSILVAAYFAVGESRDHVEVDGRIWVLDTAVPFIESSIEFVRDPSAQRGNTGELRRLVPRELIQGSARRAFDVGPEDEPLPTVMDFEPDQISPRMPMQHSVFTIHANGQALEDYAPTALYKFRIPASAKPGFRQWFNRLEITSRWLFPDLDHLAQDIDRQYGQQSVEQDGETADSREVP